jgi:hypothetical protein
MAIQYTMIITDDVSLQDNVTLSDGTTVVNKYITRVKGILEGVDEETGESAELDLYLEATNPSQKNPADFVEYDALVNMPESLKSGLVDLGNLPQNQYQIRRTLYDFINGPYSEVADWAEQQVDIENKEAA